LVDLIQLTIVHAKVVYVAGKFQNFMNKLFEHPKFSLEIIIIPSDTVSVDGLDELGECGDAVSD
jgi:hypothetical protein